MVWKYDLALIKGRENMTRHPLDRNRLQMQDTEGKGERKWRIWLIDWEAKVADIKGYQPRKVWKNIHRVIHLLGQLDNKPREGVGDTQTSRLHKVEYSSRISKVHCSEIGRGTSTDCSHDLLKELAKTLVYYDSFKLHQRLQDLEVVIFSMRWR